MLSLTLGINQVIIYIYKNKGAERQSKHPIHQLHEHDWVIEQPEGRDQELIMIVLSLKGYLWNILSSYPQLVIPGP